MNLQVGLNKSGASLAQATGGRQGVDLAHVRGHGSIGPDRYLLGFGCFYLGEGSGLGG